MWKILTLWRKIPPDIKQLIIWIVTEIVNMISGKKKDVISTLIKFINKTNLNVEHKKFMILFIRSAYDDGRLDRKELIDLASALFDMRGIPVEMKETEKQISITIKK